MAYLRQWRERILGWVPSVCPLCLERACGGCLCRACHDALRLARLSACCCDRCGLSGVETGDCPDCQVLSPVFQRVVTAFDYAAPGDLLVQQFKQSRLSLGRALADLLVQALAQAPAPDWCKVCWIPVPSTSAALRRRGYNPAAELARCLAARLGGSVRTDILAPCREAAPLTAQKRLPRQRRLLARRHAYVCRRSLPDAPLVLVDDVMTTGATLQAAAQALHDAGGRDILAVVAARTPYLVR